MKRVFEIKRSLEEAYDIPFQVELHTGPEPGYVIRPDMPSKKYFDIDIEFRNHVRMIITFRPQLYGAPFVKNMGLQSEESKQSFSEYSKCLKNEGCNVEFCVNSYPQNSEDPSSWPHEIWDKVSIKVTKAPFEIEDGQDYGDLVLHFGQLTMGMILSLSDIVPLEEDSVGYKEGAEQNVRSKRYERNRLNRELCLLNKGYKCLICGFDFESYYGSIGRKFIHVHHIVPVSQIGPHYIINPVRDLIPVCPNCHAMLHRKDPPYLPEELISIIKTEQSNTNE